MRCWVAGGAFGVWDPSLDPCCGARHCSFARMCDTSYLASVCGRAPTTNARQPPPRLVLLLSENLNQSVAPFRYVRRWTLEREGCLRFACQLHWSFSVAWPDRSTGTASQHSLHGTIFAGLGKIRRTTTSSGRPRLLPPLGVLCPEEPSSPLPQ